MLVFVQLSCGAITGMKGSNSKLTQIQWNLLLFWGYKRHWIMSECPLWPFEIVMFYRCQLTERERHLALAHNRTGSRQTDVANELTVSLAVWCRRTP